MPSTLDDARMFCGAGAKTPTVRINPYPTQIQAVGIPAHLHAYICLGVSIAVSNASNLEQFESSIVQLKQTALSCPSGILGRTGSMLGIVSVILALRVMQYRKETGNSHVCAQLTRQPDAVISHARPMPRPVDSRPVQPKLAAYLLHQCRCNQFAHGSPTRQSICCSQVLRALAATCKGSRTALPAS